VRVVVGIFLTFLQFRKGFLAVFGLKAGVGKKIWENSIFMVDKYMIIIYKYT
jgi:hypothetical protein